MSDTASGRRFTEYVDAYEVTTPFADVKPADMDVVYDPEHDNFVAHHRLTGQSVTIERSELEYAQQVQANAAAGFTTHYDQAARSTADLLAGHRRQVEEAHKGELFAPFWTFRDMHKYKRDVLRPYTDRVGAQTAEHAVQMAAGQSAVLVNASGQVAARQGQVQMSELMAIAADTAAYRLFQEGRARAIAINAVQQPQREHELALQRQQIDGTISVKVVDALLERELRRGDAEVAQVEAQGRVDAARILASAMGSVDDAAGIGQVTAFANAWDEEITRMELDEASTAGLFQVAQESVKARGVALGKMPEQITAAIESFLAPQERKKSAWEQLTAREQRLLAAANAQPTAPVASAVTLPEVDTADRVVKDGLGGTYVERLDYLTELSKKKGVA